MFRVTPLETVIGVGVAVLVIAWAVYLIVAPIPEDGDIAI
jgi:hypothetical protein